MLFLTPQPGWAFVTLAELRRRGVTGYAAFQHRDSSIVVPLAGRLPPNPLYTPADVYGCLLYTEGDGPMDATARFRWALDPERLRREVERWAPGSPGLKQGRGPRRGARRAGIRPPVTRPVSRGSFAERFSIGSEVWGETSLHRSTLRAMVGDALRAAFPRWQEYPAGGLRFFCKADARAAILGLRLYSNLRPGEASRWAGGLAPGGDGGKARVGKPGFEREPDSRPGTLREHLACGLLTLAQVEPDGAVLDPFMGSGTILRLAWERFGVRTCIGCEVDGAAYEMARGTIGAPDARLAMASFEQGLPGGLPQGTGLVSNLPFGVRFREVPTERLIRYLDTCWPRLGAMALLTGRQQGDDVGRHLGLRTKNVLVLGRPASIIATS